MNQEDKTQEEKESRFEFYVAGVRFHEFKTCIDEIEVGNFLIMRAEPSNKFDPNAIRLEFDSLEQGRAVMVGYVKGTISASVSALMEVMDLCCEVVELNKEEKPWKQIKVAIKEV